MFEYTPISEEDLLDEGVSTDELRALRLLTRDRTSRSTTRYLGHVRLIADAVGPGADIAREVKHADLVDRAAHPTGAGGDWSPPYALGLEILRRYCRAIATRSSSSGSRRWSASTAASSTSISTQLTSPVKAFGDG